MLSTTELVDAGNGQKARKTIIGTVTTTEDAEHRISYETASWYTLVNVPAGTYDVYLHAGQGITWGMIGYHGTITKEHFVNRLFTSSSVHEPTGNIGKETRCTAQTYPYILAEAFATDPRFTLADDWTVGSVERTFQDGRPYTAYHLIGPDQEERH